MHYCDIFDIFNNYTHYEPGSRLLRRWRPRDVLASLDISVENLRIIPPLRHIWAKVKGGYYSTILIKIPFGSSWCHNASNNINIRHNTSSYVTIRQKNENTPLNHLNKGWGPPFGSSRGIFIWVTPGDLYLGHPGASGRRGSPGGPPVRSPAEISDLKVKGGVLF